MGSSEQRCVNVGPLTVTGVRYGGGRPTIGKAGVGVHETLCTVFIISIPLELSKIRGAFLQTKKERVTLQAREMEDGGSAGGQPGSKGCPHPESGAHPESQGFGEEVGLGHSSVSHS